MACLKTGAWAFVETGGYYIYGDAYAYGHPRQHLYTFRVVWKSNKEPMNWSPDFVISDYYDWWDADKTNEHGSTLVAGPNHVHRTKRLINYLRGVGNETTDNIIR